MQIETDPSSAPADSDPPAESGGRGPAVIDKRVFWLQVASLVVVTGVSLAAIPYAEEIRQNAGPAYLALFVVSVQSGALFMLPGFGWASIAVFAVAFDNVLGAGAGGHDGPGGGRDGVVPARSYRLTVDPTTEVVSAGRSLDQALGPAGDLCHCGPAQSRI